MFSTGRVIALIAIDEIIFIVTFKFAYMAFKFHKFSFYWSGRQFSIICDLRPGKDDALPLSYTRILNMTGT